MTCTEFFRHAALSYQSGESWHNYAICLMLVFRDFKNVREALKAAVRFSPHDKRIINNFDTLIQDEDFMGMKSWNVYDEMRTEQQNRKR